MTSELIFSRIKTRDGYIAFKTPYSVVVQERGGELFASDLRLSLFAFGRNLEELQREINSELTFMWEHIACEDDEALTADAKVIKSWLRENLVLTRF